MSGAAKESGGVRSPIPTEALRLVLEFLPPNDLALAGRLTCRDAARWFSSVRSRTARFSQPLPQHAVESFQLRARQCMPMMTRNQKLRFLLSAAASGSEVNTAAIWALIRPGLFPEPLSPNALATTTLDFQYIVSASEEDDPGWVACKHGHPHLVGWMLQHGWTLDPAVTLEAAARFCDLAALKQIWEQLRHDLRASVYLRVGLATDAAASSTPDALDKLQWVLDEAGDGLRPTGHTVAGAIRGGLETSRNRSSSSGGGGSGGWGSSRGGDGDGAGGDSGSGSGQVDEEVLRRLQWLRDRGYSLVGAEALSGALGHAPLAVAQWLLADATARWQEQPQQGSQGMIAHLRKEFGHDEYGLWPVSLAALQPPDAVAKLRWLRQHGLLQTDGALEAAALCGNLDAVRYLHEQCGCRLTAGAFSSAVRADSLPTAAWLLQAGCPLPPSDVRQVDDCVYVKAAGRGSVRMVRWLLEQARCTLVYDAALLEQFVAAWVSPVHGLGPGGLEGRPVGHGAGGGGGGGAGDAGPGEGATGSEGGSCGGGDGDGSGDKLLSAVQLLMRAGCKVGPGVIVSAARRGDLRLVQVLHATGECPLGLPVLSAAAESGCEALVEWLVGAGCDMVVVPRDHKNPYLAAAEEGDLAMMRALRRLGVPWGLALLYQAVVSGLPYSVLRWLRGQGLGAVFGEANAALESLAQDEDEEEEGLSDEEGEDSEGEGKEEDEARKEGKAWLREWLLELADGEFSED